MSLQSMSFPSLLATLAAYLLP